MAILDPVFNPLLLPLVNSSPIWGIVVLAFLISLIITVVYKYTTNQELMKELKGKQKAFSGRMKELKDNPTEMMKVQKEAMSVNGQYMKLSLKPTLYTMLPILLIFGWMSAHLAYEPIFPGEKFAVEVNIAPTYDGDIILNVGDGVTIVGDNSQKALSGLEEGNMWVLKAEEGEYDLTFVAGEEEKIKSVSVSKEFDLKDPILTSDNELDNIQQIEVKYKDLKPLGGFSLGSYRPGWLMVYIILSFAFSIGIRKLMKVH